MEVQISLNKEANLRKGNFPGLFLCTCPQVKIFSDLSLVRLETTSQTELVLSYRFLAAGATR